MASDTLQPGSTTLDVLTCAQGLGLDRLDAQLLLGHVLQRSRAWLLAHDRDPLPPDAMAPLSALLQRRAEGEPLAYLVGDQEFHGLNLQVNPAVLIPRPDTETLVAWALETLPPEAEHRVLDLGTGSGAIALALADQRPKARIHAVDASAEALAVAKGNAERLGLPVQFALGSWFGPVTGQRFELVISNPPYIAEGDEHLPALRFEPKQALTSGPDGLDDIRLIVGHAPAHLAAGGWLLLEHGWDQHEAVAQLLREQGFQKVGCRQDLGGQWRCTGGQWPGA